MTLLNRLLYPFGFVVHKSSFGYHLFRQKRAWPVFMKAKLWRAE